MAPRAKGAGTHRDFDIGVAGRRTGVAAPSNVRRNSQDFEDFDGYYGGASPPNKKAATPHRYAGGGAASSSVGRKSAASAGAPWSAGRAKANRPDLYHEIGERGRKTGIKVPKNVGRDSNDFERFDEFLSSLSPEPANRTARNAATRIPSSGTRRPAPQPQYEEEEDEEEDTTGTRRDDDDDGTRAMSLVDGDTGPSPETYLSNARASQGRPSLTDLNESVGSQRTYDDADMVDYDMPFSPPVLSPGQGRKRLSEGSQDDGDDDGDVSAMSKRRKSARSSLGTPTSAKGKGKARAVSEEVVEQQDEDGDEEEQQEVEEVEEIEVVHEGYPSDFDDNPDDTFARTVNGNGPESRTQLPDIIEEEEEEEEEDDDDEEVSVRRTKSAPKPRKQYVRDDPPGVRRSKRERIAPLDFWRNEKVVYRRRVSSGLHGGVRGVPVVTIADVVRRPSEKPEPFAAKWKRYGSARPGSVAPAAGGHRGRYKSEGTAAPEEGMDTGTRPEGVVWSWEKNDETTRRVAFTSQMVETRPHLLMRGRTANGDVDEDEPPFVFQKVFTELDYMAGGLLTIPVGKGKPMKPSKDNSYMFYVLEGAVTVTVHRTSFVVAPNGMFMVPRGNLYGIDNAGERNARLFFVQARRTPLDEATLAQAQEASFLQQAEEEAPEEEEQDDEEEEEESEEEPPPPKKKRGRPPKAKPKPVTDSSEEEDVRPRKKKLGTVKRR